MKLKPFKISAWIVGVALAGAILGAKQSYAHGWFKPLIDKPAFVLGGALIGLVLGVLFSLLDEHKAGSVGAQRP